MLEETSYKIDMKILKKRIWKWNGACLNSQKWATIDTCLAQIANILNVNKCSRFEIDIPATGGRSILTGTGYKVRIFDIDMEDLSDKSPCYFTIAKRSEDGRNYVSSGLHHYLYYDKKQKIVLGSNLELKPLSFSLFPCLSETAVSSIVALDIWVITADVIMFTALQVTWELPDAKTLSCRISLTIAN